MGARCLKALFAGLLLVLLAAGSASGDALSHSDAVRALAKQPNKFRERRPHKDDAGEAPRCAYSRFPRPVKASGMKRLCALARIARIDPVGGAPTGDFAPPVSSAWDR